MHYDAIAAIRGSKEANSENGLPEGDAERNLVAFHDACQETYKDLIGYACGVVESAELAQDIVQQAFANTLVVVERGGQIQNMGGFLYRCVHNLCVNNARRKSVLSLSDEPYIEVENLTVELPEKSPAATVEISEKWREIEGIVDQLAPNQRNVFILAELKGYGYDEIAESMNRSTNSVRQLLSRARQKIRTMADAGANWGGIPIPTLKMDFAFARDDRFTGPHIFDRIQARASKVQSWLGNTFQGSAEAVLQHSGSVVAGTVVAVLAVASPAPPAELGPPDAAPVAVVIKAPEKVTTHRKSSAKGTETDPVELAPVVELVRQANDIPKADTGKRPDGEHGGSNIDKSDDRSLSDASDDSNDLDSEDSGKKNSGTPDPIPQGNGGEDPPPPPDPDPDSCPEEGGGHDGRMGIECVNRDISRDALVTLHFESSEYQSAGSPGVGDDDDGTLAAGNGGGGSAIAGGGDDSDGGDESGDGDDSSAGSNPINNVLQ